MTKRRGRDALAEPIGSGVDSAERFARYSFRFLAGMRLDGGTVFMIIEVIYCATLNRRPSSIDHCHRVPEHTIDRENFERYLCRHVHSHPPPSLLVSSLFRSSCSRAANPRSIS